MDGNSLKTSAARTPLFEEFVRNQPAHPPHIPTWIVPAGWITFLVIAISSELIDPSGDVFPALGALAGWGLVLFLRHHFRAKTEEQLRDERIFEVVKKLKFAQKNAGGLKKHLPPAVLPALEKVMVAYHSALSFEPTSDQNSEAERALRSSLLTIAPVIRGKAMSRSDWNAICDDKRLVNQVVDSLHDQFLRLQESKPLDPARLAALEELERDTNPINLREY
jgi:hypothetical protein